MRGRHKAMHKDHPNLSPEINRNIRESELSGGVWVKELKVGERVEMQTRNTLYLIEKREDGLYISGHLGYCRVPTKAYIHGSTWGGSMLKVGFVGVGMHLEFATDEHPDAITTSTIADVKLIAEKSEAA